MSGPRHQAGPFMDVYAVIIIPPCAEPAATLPLRAQSAARRILQSAAQQLSSLSFIVARRLPCQDVSGCPLITVAKHGIETLWPFYDHFAANDLSVGLSQCQLCFRHSAATRRTLGAAFRLIMRHPYCLHPPRQTWVKYPLVFLKAAGTNCCQLIATS